MSRYVLPSATQHNDDDPKPKPKRKANKPPRPPITMPGGDSGGADDRLSLESLDGKTQLSNARRLVKLFGASCRFVPAWGCWLVYDGRRWVIDTGEVRMMKHAGAVADIVWQATRQHMTAEAVRFAMGTASGGGMTAMVKIAESLLAIDYAILDTQPLLLNCPNGTIDLTTGTLRRHAASDYITKLCPTRFDPQAECPRWLQFLDDVFASAPLVDYTRRLSGWWLTGLVREHLLHIAHGVGANGKSTLFNALSEVLGSDYAMTAMPTLLVESRQESHPTERADLHGKRLVLASETEAGAKLSESLVKSLTGGDRIRARRMRENFWEFAPTHKLVLLTNHKPRVRGTDHAIWRRLRLLPFNQVFDGDRADKTLPEKLRAEAEGILAWAVRGCLEWQRDGLRPPAEVTLATDSYRTSQDVCGRFATECCVVGSSSFVTKFADLRGEIERWCDDTGERVPSAKAFAQWLQDQGMEAFRSNGMRYRGIGLKTDDAEGWNDGT